MLQGGAVRQRQVGRTGGPEGGKHCCILYSCFQGSLSQALRKWVNPSDELSGKNALGRSHYKVINLLKCAVSDHASFTFPFTWLRMDLSYNSLES